MAAMDAGSMIPEEGACSSTDLRRDPPAFSVDLSTFDAEVEVALPFTPFVADTEVSTDGNGPAFVFAVALLDKGRWI